jgi:hypothetical protein
MLVFWCFVVLVFWLFGWFGWFGWFGQCGGVHEPGQMSCKTKYHNIHM